MAKKHFLPHADQKTESAVGAGRGDGVAVSHGSKLISKLISACPKQGVYTVHLSKLSVKCKNPIFAIKIWVRSDQVKICQFRHTLHLTATCGCPLLKPQRQRCTQHPKKRGVGNPGPTGGYQQVRGGGVKILPASSLDCRCWTAIAPKIYNASKIK